ncbi:MAG: tRNA (N(6)-L-threonylcarbamoyladenosine(37)-C(2))-methylthiotransferase [Candidatus Aenigmarchaeota archaeon]|nr:tRNA (N(6)-L-threonylcarbamoyladenosine(37)-C(2))-methylthiotransferase [Candidatus Aenigmarchaeota archaeon]MBU5688689.1 tRNA (N(6)-L-threonylcarbamoyladenosine(37)-C(2))-methylthiotransferase [Candidatus Aenigmarchaeota archaeon]
MKVYIETYGCSANKSDSEIMAGILMLKGYEIVFDQTQADYIIINTCGVKKQTEDRILRRLQELSKSEKKIIVAGCLTKIDLEKIKSKIPNYHALTDPYSIDKIDIALEKGGLIFSEKPSEKPSLPKYSFNSVISIVQILEGCLSACTFCGTKLARGRATSFRPSSIINSIKDSINRGYKEIWLTSQDNSCYGKDIGTNLAELMNGISKIKGKFWVRVGMMNPLHIKPFLDDLIHVYKNEKFFKFLHIPVQSGSDKILKDMRRGYKVEDFLFYVKRFREEIDYITISTDIIVGYPTEKEKDFRDTIKLIKKVKPDVVNLSRFTPRKGTLAAQLKQLDPKVVNKRSQKIHKLVRKILEKKNKKWVGWKGEALIDEKNKNITTARNIYYKPIIVQGDLGQFRQVEITKSFANYFVGK